MSEVTLERGIQGTHTQEMTPGALLQQKREQAGYSVGYVAEQLRLTDNYVLYLERDEFEKLPAEPFVLGYYRAYARLLNIPADQLIQGYRDYRQQLDSTFEQVAGSQRSPQTAAHNRGPGGRFYLLIGVALAATWVAVSLLSQQDKAAPSEVASVPSSSAELVAGSADHEEAGSGSGASETPVEQGDYRQSVESMNDSTLSEAVVENTDTAESIDTVENTDTAESIDTVDNTDAAENTDTADSVDITDSTGAAENSDAAVNVTQTSGVTQPSAITANSLDTLSLLFTAECWVEVTDSQGDVIAAELYQAGDRAELQGLAPFDVMFGNVRAISVEMNGQPVEVTPRGSRKTLRMTIDASI